MCVEFGPLLSVVMTPANNQQKGFSEQRHMLRMLFNPIELFYFYIRPIVKWFLRKLTRLCELQRICYGAEEGSIRTKNVEWSLRQSRSPKIQSLIKNLDESIKACPSYDRFRKIVVYRATVKIMEIKEIKSNIHPHFYMLFWDCAESIWGYKRLYHLVEELRITPYDCNNLEHEGKLLELWKLLMPSVKLEKRVTKQWQDIGFQGDDPKTDFRGMGLLGLENLLYFAKEFNGSARHLLSHSLHPVYGYTFAIVGINLTSMAYTLLKDGSAKTHFYNNRRCPTIETFHIFYCYLFYEFDKYWMQCKPSSIMDFSAIQQKFNANIRKELLNETTHFKINLAIENI